MFNTIFNSTDKESTQYLLGMPVDLPPRTWARVIFTKIGKLTGAVVSIRPIGGYK